MDNGDIMNKTADNTRANGIDLWLRWAVSTGRVDRDRADALRKALLAR